MRKSLRKKLDARKQRTAERIDKYNWNGQSPMIDPPTIVYELATRTQAIAAGGLGVVQQLVGQLGIAQSINRGCPIFKFCLPYHLLLVTLANTREVLYVENRAGNRPSHEHAAGYFDRAVQLCRWHEDNVEFVFGMDAVKNLVKIAENLPDAVT